VLQYRHTSIYTVFVFLEGARYHTLSVKMGAKFLSGHFSVSNSVIMVLRENLTPERVVGLGTTPLYVRGSSQVYL
jgi:hypothetical protein